MRVIVEGVEEEAQLKLLREIGADEVQGYLLGRPQDGSLKFDKSAASIEKRSCSEVFGFLSRGRVKRGLGSAT
jgi:EAL domain-containing protein (putative c-di-GMP-specific phosphodiesterase class I)